MKALIVVTWIALPTVMYGGFSLLQFLTRAQRPLSPWQLGMFRAGHAHAGVLLLMTLLFESFIQDTTYSSSAQVAWSVVVFVGVLLQSGGFFVHMGVGSEGAPSIGTRITMAGALVLAVAVVALVVGIIRT